MNADALGLPTVIIPYPGPCDNPDSCQDIFVYLRPETNGMIAESTIFKVIQAANEHQSVMKLIYLANIPGEFIVERRIVEQYYALRLHFSVLGAKAFTADMSRRFSLWSGQAFESAPLIGGFDAVSELGMSAEELFSTWVPETDLITLNGQLIKKIDGRFVVNYDIPALMHKNSKKTDIALMIFRTELDYDRIRALIAGMHTALCAAGVLDPQYDAARAFHFSRSPLDQLLDGLCYLDQVSDCRCGLEGLTFYRWLAARNFPESRILSLLKNPIARLASLNGGQPVEENLFSLARWCSYAQTLALLQSVVEQQHLVNHAPILDKLLKSG